MSITEDAEVVAAMLILRGRMQQVTDPIEMGGFVAQVGEYVLERLGFAMDQAAHVAIDIGTDDCPDQARITLTWSLPEGSFADESPLAGVNEMYERP